MIRPVVSVDPPATASSSDAALRRQDVLRWTVCAAVALTAHVGVALALAWRSEKMEPESGASVVMIELAPVATAPSAPQTELPPGPAQVEAEAQQEMHKEVETKPPDEPHEKEEPETPEVSPPPPEPVREPVETKAEQQAVEKTEVATAPPSVAVEASQAAGPPIGAVSKTASAAIITWRRTLLGQLQRFHRYPRRTRNESGIAEVEFAIDRAGRVLSSRIIKSSGYAMLDEDALALIRRASPFPSPPADLSNDLLTMVVPVRYDAAAR